MSSRRLRTTDTPVDAKEREATPSAKAREAVSRPDAGLRRHLLAGFLLLFLLVGGLGSWAATAQLAGAVIAGGTVTVDSNVKKVQHLSGGIVGELKVRNGDKVEAGDLLLRLNDTIVRTNLQIVVNQLDQLAARQARLKAERDGANEVPVPASMKERLMQPEVVEILEGEMKLFESRRASRQGQKAQLGERISQYREEIVALTTQGDAKNRELELIAIELASQKTLWEKQLMPLNKYTALQRDQARIQGEWGAVMAQAAQSKGKISEIELQILQIDNDFRSEVMRDLREAQGKEAEFTERRVAAVDQLNRIDVRAPQAGIVHDLAVHTVGGVIGQGDTIMLIVPQNDRLIIEARIAPQDIDHVRIGQPAHIRFPAFNQQTTPEFDGVVEHVSADATRETQGPQAGQSYFVARVKLRDDQIKRLGNRKLQPGMPAEVHVRTIERTAISYFLKPLQDQMTRTFKEQ